ncbi:TonB-dependent siderophore receptor [Agrobacterium rubi]|uniref:TonB-dependent siderophore receptor n=1 Tax=Agrobacterium rubi TaxID=28099 RepID=UPI001572F807|nr:TonB-dependent siderophore receptor [Agrobacterium rubi]NTF09820.1 TonB-dependent siderophore receptor [Agrobacterium rubi]NTF22003.1 TonB-dependent siderophore receptor [Agrobacterium rubi]NTF28860.1 TonB-dependent siderophore receptor [Agrobacterium rubi]
MKIEKKSANSGQQWHHYDKAILLGCTALVALTPLQILAQEAGAAGGTVLETIVVDGSGGDDNERSIVARQTTGAGKMPSEVLTTAASVSVITAKEIKERAATSVEQVVQYTAGVVTDFYGSDDRWDFFDIRGFTPYTYRDGLAIGRTFGGVREEPYAFERIEVLKGTSSSSFGSAEPGGAVNYVTKLPKSERFGEAYVTGGSFDHKEVGLDFGDNITQDDTLSYRFTGKFQDADAEYDHSKDNEKFVMGGLTWRPTHVTSLSFVFDHLNKDGVPGSGGQPFGTDFDRSKFFGEPDYYFNNTNRNTYSLMFDHDFGDGLSFGSKARYSKTNTGFGSAYLQNPTVGFPNLTDRYFFGSDKSSEQFVIDANLVYERNFDDIESRTLLGVEYNNFKSEEASLYVPNGPSPIDSTNPVYTGGPNVGLTPGNGNDQTTRAIYLQQDVAYQDRLTVSLGLRNDWLDLSQTELASGASTSSDHSEFSKKVGLSYKITEEFAAFASYAESAAPPGVGTEPTTGKQYEVGVKYQPDAFPALLTASLYDLTKGNITVYDSVTYLPDSVEKVRHRGIELEAKAELTNNINLIAAYSYIDSKIEEPGGANDGNRLMRVPKHVASIWTTYTLEGEGARGDMTFGVGARYSDSYFTNIQNTIASESAVVFDAAFTYKIKENTTLQLNASNLFDEKHVASQDSGGVYYNPGRAIYATLRQTW